MYWPISGIKKDPYKRWHRPDRVFFGFGACHILAGVYLSNPPLEGFYGEWVVPHDGFSGHHIYVTDGILIFDFHGYSLRSVLLDRYWKVWASKYDGWNADIESVNFSLLDTLELNKRSHLGPDQFLKNPIPRAKHFLDRINHKTAAAKARGLIFTNSGAKN